MRDMRTVVKIPLTILTQNVLVFTLSESDDICPSNFCGNDPFSAEDKEDVWESDALLMNVNKPQ